MALPKDPAMLFSVINTKLRDFYDSLDALCDDMDEDKDEITRLLSSYGKHYDETQNRFI